MAWTIDDHPMTVWFDDDCGLCSTVVRWLPSRCDAQVTWRSNRDLTGSTSGVGSEAVVVTSVWMGRTEGAPAVAVVLRRCGRLLGLAGRAIEIRPIRPLAAAVYARVAANRGAISARLGLRAGCDLPDAPDPGNA